MVEQQMNIYEEVRRLEEQIGRIMVTGAQEEIVDVKREIQKLSNKIEDILNQYGTAPRGVIARTVSRINDQMTDLVQRQVASTRNSDYNETRANVVMIKGDETRDTVETLAYFEQSGIVQRDGRYEATVEEICNDVVNAYRRPLEAAGRRGEDAYFEIRAATNTTRNALQELHANHSQMIKQQISHQIEEIGMKLNASLKQQVEQSADKSMEETLPPLAWDLTDSLSASTLSSDEIARNDAGELSKNAAAFRDDKQEKTTTKKDLEAMFK